MAVFKKRKASVLLQTMLMAMIMATIAIGITRLVLYRYASISRFSQKQNQQLLGKQYYSDALNSCVAAGSNTCTTTLTGTGLNNTITVRCSTLGDSATTAIGLSTVRNSSVISCTACPTGQTSC